MRFDEIFPTFLEGKKVYCDNHFFDKFDSGNIPIRLLANDTWHVKSDFDLNLEKLREVKCVNFTVDEIHRWDNTNIVDEALDFCKDSSRLNADFEVEERTWKILDGTLVHFVNDYHYTVDDKFILKKDGYMELYDKTFKALIQVDNLDLIYITKEE